MVVFRYRNGHGTYDCFAWDADGAPTRFVLAQHSTFRAMWRLVRGGEARVVLLTLNRDVAAATLNLVYDKDADPWFVPLGSEDDLAELVADHLHEPQVGTT